MRSCEDTGTEYDDTHADTPEYDDTPGKTQIPFHETIGQSISYLFAEKSTPDDEDDRYKEKEVWKVE